MVSEVALVSVLVLVLNVGAQAPAVQATASPEDLHRAMDDLQKEIVETRSEVAKLAAERNAKAARELNQLTREMRAAQEKILYQQRRIQEAKEAIAREQRTHRLLLQRRAGSVITPCHEVQLATEVRLVKTRSTPTIENAGTEQRRVTVVSDAEKAALQESIRKANNRRMCRWFHLGCIK